MYNRFIATCQHQAEQLILCLSEISAISGKTIKVKKLLLFFCYYSLINQLIGNPHGEASQKHKLKIK